MLDSDQPARVPAMTITRGRVTNRFCCSRPILPQRLPLVSCVMVTARRPQRAKLAVECFLNQTYPNTELVIVDDGPTDELADFVSGLSDDRIRMIRMSPTEATLGQLRNDSVAHSSGQFVCQWDDDDLSDPGRLWWQMGLLLEHGATACMLERWTLLWTAGPRVAIGTRRLWEGSLVARKDAIGQYPDVARGEDSPVVQRLVDHESVLVLDHPLLYTYVIHGGNTFGADHFAAHWDAASDRLVGEDAQSAVDRLADRVPVKAAIELVGYPPIWEPLVNNT